jgi:hypothetical protein
MKLNCSRSKKIREQEVLQPVLLFFNLKLHAILQTDYYKGLHRSHLQPLKHHGYLVQ